ncbi:Glucosyl-3-phosphoglycerate synthase [Botrimarina colliarenosi]|uniref:Glucosyl-3-phosphoglycerate synthase n=1 Tax=Botrimarina colliarenosi TaxID=2528001 RepID=A0A5C6AF50_9BACT|nr:TIGR04283 family arsenosugar biosynthesis glycosyltransferase [Botrimarina colliarenosi]TWT98056.1 Glucosyl-3-phosphoglycerate synthase [Botrimarina colliarenosi]
MKLSVAIPALNEEADIDACVASALGLGAGWGGPVEVVVADGGSRDATPQRAREAGATVVPCQRGRGRQLRAAIGASAGDVVLMLHADATLPPHAGRQLADALADPAVGCGAFRQHIDAGGRLYRWLEAGNAFRASHLGTPYGDQAIFVRRDLLEAIGGVPDQPLMEDVELMWRLRRHGVRPVLLDGPVEVSPRRWRRHGVVRQTARNWGLLTAYALGVSAERIASWYAPHRKG